MIQSILGSHLYSYERDYRMSYYVLQMWSFYLTLKLTVFTLVLPIIDVTIAIRQTIVLLLAARDVEAHPTMPTTIIFQQ